MDTGKLKNNTAFYDGYEDEPEISLTAAESPEYTISIWDGYFYDIFENPSLDGNGWTGFTRDIHQLEGVFSGNDEEKEIDKEEYLNDLMSYATRSFRYDESNEVLDLIADFLRFAIRNNYTVVMKKL